VTVADWWGENIVEAGKLPMLLCLTAFVMTFVITRAIVRLIRAGKGPFSNNTVGGVHIHHVVPGLILMVLGGLMALRIDDDGWLNVAGVVFGMGLALVLDEFALVLHLDDVYWEEEGRLSVDVVFVLAAVIFFVIVVGSPLGTDATAADSQTDGDDLVVRVSLLVVVVLNLTVAVLAALKGKLGAAMVGVFVPVVAYVAAIRIARPDSPWDHKRYEDRPRKRAKAQLREARFDARWRSKVDRLQDLVAGTPSGENP
jgi:hypothetical protein